MDQIEKDLEEYDKYLNYYWDSIENLRKEAHEKILVSDVFAALVVNACYSIIEHGYGENRKEFIKEMVDYYFEKIQSLKKNNNPTQKENSNHE